MNKQMRKDLEAVMYAIINEDTEASTTAFHNYLRAKTQSILAEAEDGSEDDNPAFLKKSKKDDSSEDDDSSDDDDDSSEDDKPAFLKKSKKDKDED